MKTLIGALALVFAAPVAAQTAPAPEAQGQHQGMDHSQHEQGKHDCKACCEKMKGKHGKMDCMDEKSAEAEASAQGHDSHAQ